MTKIEALDYAEGDGWSIFQGDNTLIMPQMEPNSVHLTITSIPFATIFCYSASNHDYGNARNHGEFFEHFRFWVPQVLRLTKPGRICAIHLMNIRTSKTRDGFIGLTDFRGAVIREMVDGGWIFHGETCVWKCPVTAVTRTKDLTLLYKQLRKDSTMSAMGIPDYVCFFRKPGKNAEAVEHTFESFPVEQWQKWASPVWMDIDQQDTLNARSAREHDDERHLAVLQKGVIERCLVLYSNPGDVIFDPFGGIGSTGYVAVQHDRRSTAIELKTSYFQQAVKNMQAAKRTQPSLFAHVHTKTMDAPGPDLGRAEDEAESEVEA